jgi:hypothetical protein
VCQIGFLGGLEPVTDFNPLADMPSGVALSTFASAFVLGGDGFPLGDIPIQAIVDKAERGVLAAGPARVFAFEEIVEAHHVMDAGRPAESWWSQCEPLRRLSGGRDRSPGGQPLRPERPLHNH